MSKPVRPRSREHGKATRPARLIALPAVLVAAIALAQPAHHSRGEPQAGSQGRGSSVPVWREVARRQRLQEGIVWRHSVAMGRPTHGRLAGGVLLPEEGLHFFSWDGRRDRRPNPPDRRWGTSGLVRTILRVCAEFAEANPGAPRCAVGDLSRERGGPFARRYGGDGHRSHQNGLDVDLYYPRADRAERAVTGPAGIDRALAQELVDRFVAAGAQYVFVGLHTRLHGPAKVVEKLYNHDDHMHIRLPASAANRA